ncbi:hypothetical protein L6452_26756 [Arctium lappa]|uniref:Uncharacterized protein n=1 Tax=Arctium lappa TaxID=4217 RepID=A0ACB8ZW42_ARCLA|nr:hypothetical protein L6452_26756 [Arctium lappa]
MILFRNQRPLLLLLLLIMVPDRDAARIKSIRRESGRWRNVEPRWSGGGLKLSPGLLDLGGRVWSNIFPFKTRIHHLDIESTHNSKKSLRWAIHQVRLMFLQQQKTLKDWDASNGDQNKSLNLADPCAQIEELKYLYASNVNVSNFVSEKLSGDRKYHVWKVQMVCLMETQNMHGIVDPKFIGPGAKDADTIKQYDNLLRGWIFGSLSEDVLSTVVDLDSARAVWKKLKSIYDPEKSSTQDSASPQPLTQIEIVTVTETENKDNTIRNKKLRKAMVEGRWWEAEAILKKAATEAISNEAEAIRKNPEKAATEAIGNGAEAMLKTPEKAATQAVSNGSENIWKNPEKAAAKARAINNGAEAIWKKTEKEATEGTSNGTEAIRKNPEKAATEAVSNGSEVIWKNSVKANTEAISNGSEAIWKKPEKAAIEAANNGAENIWENPEKVATTVAISNGSENTWKNPEKAATEAISNRAEAIRKFPEIAVTEATGNTTEV